MTEALGKYEKMWQEGRMPMQQYAEELKKKGIFPADLDIISHSEMQRVLMYNNSFVYRIYRNIISIPSQIICLMKK